MGIKSIDITFKMVEKVLLDFLVDLLDLDLELDLLDRRGRRRRRRRGVPKKFQKMFPAEYAAMQEALAARDRQGFKKAQKAFFEKCKSAKKAEPKKKTLKSMSRREQKTWARKFRREFLQVRLYRQMLSREERFLKKLKERKAAGLERYAVRRLSKGMQHDYAALCNLKIQASIKAMMGAKIAIQQEKVNSAIKKKEAAEAALLKKLKKQRLKLI